MSFVRGIQNSKFKCIKAPSVSINQSQAGETEEDILKQYNFALGYEKPSFNVIYVRALRPPVFDIPIVKSICGVFQETYDLIKPIMRFGLPATSFANKCPYYRPDNSPLSTTGSLRFQQALSGLDRTLPIQPNNSGREAHSIHKIPPSRFLISEPPDWAVVAAYFSFLAFAIGAKW